MPVIDVKLYDRRVTEESVPKTATAARNNHASTSRPMMRISATTAVVATAHSLRGTAEKHTPSGSTGCTCERGLP